MNDILFKLTLNQFSWPEKFSKKYAPNCSPLDHLKKQISKLSLTNVHELYMTTLTIIARIIISILK